MALIADDFRRAVPDLHRQAPAGAGRTHTRTSERRLTPLEKALRERIKARGPIGVDAFMGACNAHYYATRDPFGETGDFVTAPEISQMFGELVGAALADCWSRAGLPPNAIYVELGPGRGTLAEDALRVMQRAGFKGKAHLVETSPVLRAAQAQRLPEAIWHEDLASIPAQPLLLVANEFLDALPIRQFADGAERKVVTRGGALAFHPQGAIVEDSPVRDSVVRALGERVVRDGGVALIFDYGHAVSGRGETLQAVRSHRFAAVLESPGEQDLTAHVDFKALAEVAASTGARVTAVIGQGTWLERLGIRARASSLASTNPSRAAEIDAARARLCDAEQMGELFKVIGLTGPSWPTPAGFADAS